MNQDDVKKIVQNELSKSQYNVGKGYYHTHNGTDSPQLNISSSLAGVSSVTTSGSGINATPNVGAVVISNTGVTSAVAGTAIDLSAAVGAVTITNTGVTSLIAGTGISLSSATGAVTVISTGTGATQTTLYSTIGPFQITPAGDNIYHSISTFAVPALMTGDVMFVKVHVTCNDTHTLVTNKSVRVTMNSATIAAVTQTSSSSGGPGGYYLDFHLLADPASTTQAVMGTSYQNLPVSGYTQFIIENPGADPISVDLSSPFTLSVDGLLNISGSPTMNGSWSLDYFEVIIFAP